VVLHVNLNNETAEWSCIVLWSRLWLAGFLPCQAHNRRRNNHTTDHDRRHKHIFDDTQCNVHLTLN
jgi:hypothetical protein